MKISFIIPSRNNLKYLKWCCDSIRKNQDDHEVEICIADDASTDGTWNWCQEMMEKDSNFKAIRNEGPERQGLVILNDKLIDEVASYDICMVFHADMYLCPGSIDAIEKYIKPKTIVSLTRIEPPLHPEGSEKIVKDYGIEPEEFKEEELLNFLYRNEKLLGRVTEGIFAPWAFYKKDFQEIGGHDVLFAPQSKEDSDIFNRFQLNGVHFIQTWRGSVYHMTSRGSRFNPYSGGAPGKNSDEWIGTTTKNMRNFIRKWGHAVKHDDYMKPIIPPKYDVGFKIHNCNLDLLKVLEPWCTTLYCDEQFTIGRVADYVEMEDTTYDLYDKILKYDDDVENGILVEIDGTKFTQQDYNYIQNFAEIIANDKDLPDQLIHFSDDPEFELGNLKVTINSLKTYEKELIICKKQ